MATIPPTNGINASRHAPTNQHINDINMTENNHTDIDPVSKRKIINSRITIRNLTYTAPPPGGFPLPQITKSVTFAQSDEILRRAEELPNYKIWIRPWAMRFTTELQAARQNINKTLMDFFDREPADTFSLTQPFPDKAHENEPDGNPWNFLLSGLSEAEYYIAVKTGIIASKQAILFITAFNQPTPSFVMMLTGITFDEGRINEAKEATVEAIQRTLSSKPQIAVTLTNRIVDPSQALIEYEAFLTGLSATYTPVPNSSKTFWRISSSNMPNFSSIEEYNTFITSFINMQFFTGNFGTGETPKRGENFNCNFCKSREHHTENCPYPNIPGWLSPPENAFPWTDPDKKKQTRGGPKRGGYKGNRNRHSQNYEPYRRND